MEQKPTSIYFYYRTKWAIKPQQKQKALLILWSKSSFKKCWCDFWNQSNFSSTTSNSLNESASSSMWNSFSSNDGCRRSCLLWLLPAHCTAFQRRCRRFRGRCALTLQRTHSLDHWPEIEPETWKLHGNVSSRSLRRLKPTLAVVVLSSAVAFSSYLVAHDVTLRRREKTLRAERLTTRRNCAIATSAINTS